MNIMIKQIEKFMSRYKTKKLDAPFYRIKNNEVAVDLYYEWQPIETCPRKVKVQLLGEGNVAVYSHYTGQDTFFKAWAPLPNIPYKIKHRAGSKNKVIAP